MLRLYNTLTRKTEEFQTLEPGLVKMYVCGVTVYNDAHVGHAMSALVFDIVRRYLEYRGYRVRLVMNFTDVDDKIINRANQLGEDPLRLAQRYIDDYRQNLNDLNVLPAASNPRATQTMVQIQAMIAGLVGKGFAYVPGNGDVYFRVTKDPGYGKLSGRRIEDMQAGARIEVEEQKEHPMDFALWKGAKPGEPAWDSPWGKGRPGWHIECSAMNLAELGEQIDIHGGGNDLVFPHHENEIAQSECYTGKPFARYWMHNGMLQLGSEKMSKSLGNIISIKEFLSKREADVMRMCVLNGSYRAPLIFNDETLDSAEKGLERLKSGLRPASPSADGLTVEAAGVLVTHCETAQQAFTDAMDSDFNTSGAVAALHELVRQINSARDAGATGEQLQPAQATLRALAGVFGLRLEAKKTGREDVKDRLIEFLGKYLHEDSGRLREKNIENLIESAVVLRNRAREEKNWQTSDEYRDTLEDLGIKLEDNLDGTTWRWR